MKGFLLGLVVAAIGFGGYLYWKQRFAAPAPRPGAVVDAGTQAKATKEKKRRRRGAHLVRVPVSGPSGGTDRGRAEAPPPLEPEPEPVKLGAADLKLVAQGDDLSRPDVKRFDMSDDSGTHDSPRTTSTIDFGPGRTTSWDASFARGPTRRPTSPVG